MTSPVTHPALGEVDDGGDAVHLLVTVSVHDVIIIIVSIRTLGVALLPDKTRTGQTSPMLSKSGARASRYSCQLCNRENRMQGTGIYHKKYKYPSTAKYLKQKKKRIRNTGINNIKRVKTITKSLHKLIVNA